MLELNPLLKIHIQEKNKKLLFYVASNKWMIFGFYLCLLSLICSRSPPYVWPHYVNPHCLSLRKNTVKIQKKYFCVAYVQAHMEYKFKKNQILLPDLIIDHSLDFSEVHFSKSQLSAF